MLISERYRELNKRLHENPSYGVSGHKWSAQILELCSALGTTDVLDYGCGKRTLERALGFDIHNYDPCVDGCDGDPEPADIVVCGDVLEHIEPECLDDVLDDIKRVTKRLAFLIIANRPAKKFLEDGRNAHLIQEGVEWWLPKLSKRFRVERFINLGGEMVFLVSHK